VFGAVRRLAELHAQIHRVTAPAGLPSLRDRIAASPRGSKPPTPLRRTNRGCDSSGEKNNELGPMALSEGVLPSRNPSPRG
jgi:hypothetical protein